MYNPMWNLFGDFKYPPGTYYRAESKFYNPCWYMLDQVIMSQSMIPLMVREQLKIITKCGKNTLYTGNKYPNSHISDHFQLCVSLKYDRRRPAMNKETFNFDLKDTMSPEEVIIEDAKK